MKARFIIVGSGWRSMFYARITKALPEQFELGAMLCRTQEKADKISKEMNIHTTTSIEECENYKPDFVVVAVNKSSICEVAKEWMAKGFTVLCETPAALKLEDLQELWRLRHEKGYKLCVAEQYFKYPSYEAVLSTLESKIIGEPYNATLSAAHDYHGASLVRKILGITNELFSVSGKRYTFSVKETVSRYEKFTDGRTADRKRDHLIFEFENGKVAFYDFCSEQYRSPIRNNYLQVQGMQGEIKDDTVYYLDEHNEPQKKMIYAPPLGISGLTEDETAIASLMKGAAEYNKSDTEIYPLSYALQDAYMAILMQSAVSHPGKIIKSERQPWNE